MRSFVGICKWEKCKFAISFCRRCNVIAIIIIFFFHSSIHVNTFCKYFSISQRIIWYFNCEICFAWNANNGRQTKLTSFKILFAVLKRFGREKLLWSNNIWHVMQSPEGITSMKVTFLQWEKLKFKIIWFNDEKASSYEFL